MFDHDMKRRESDEVKAKPRRLSLLNDIKTMIKHVERVFHITSR